MAQRLSVVMTLLLCQPAAAPPALALALVPSAAAASCAAAAARRALASICSCFISHQKMAACSICPAELQATSSEPHSLAVGQKPSAAMRRQVASTPSKSREYECTCARGVGGGGGERGRRQRGQSVQGRRCQAGCGQALPAAWPAACLPAQRSLGPAPPASPRRAHLDQRVESDFVGLHAVGLHPAERDLGAPDIPCPHARLEQAVEGAGVGDQALLAQLVAPAGRGGGGWADMRT